MSRDRLFWCGWITAALAIAATGPARADLVRLKNGGEIRGTIVSGDEGAESATLSIETLTGAVVVIASDDVQFLTRRPLKVEEYETRAKSVERTVEAHWKLAEWCRKNNLDDERDEQLELILELDPEHEKAHYGLKHAKRNGEWMTRDELMTSQGYVKYKGKYITPQELELLEKSAEEREREREWYKKVRLWFGWLTGRSAERQQQGLAELQQISDPDAVPALTQLMQDHDNKAVRSLFVQILSRIPGPKPVAALVVQSLKDTDRIVRSDALEAIREDQYAAAAPLYVQALSDDWNVIVRRAGAALARMGSENDVPALVEALVTTHKYRVRVPDNANAVSFGTDGSFRMGGPNATLPPDIQAMLLTGQLPHGVIVTSPNTPKRSKVVLVRQDHQNSEVLGALRKLTEQDYGYDERTWRLWWNAKKNGLDNSVPVLP